MTKMSWLTQCILPPVSVVILGRKGIKRCAYMEYVFESLPSLIAFVYIYFIYWKAAKVHYNTHSLQRGSVFLIKIHQ